MAASFPHHSCRREQGRARHCDRNPKRAADPRRCTRIRQVALPANQPSCSKQQWAPRDVQRHRGSLHPRRAQRRSEPSIGSESLFHNCNLPPLSPQVGFATLGRSGGLDDRAARPRELAERAGEEERSRKPNPVEDPTGHRFSTGQKMPSFTSTRNVSDSCPGRSRRIRFALSASPRPATSTRSF
jgi:hypothetical protein